MANFAPRLCAELQRACRDRDFPRAMALQTRLAPRISALEREINPGPVKLTLSLLRPDLAPDLRLPLVSPAPETAAAVAQALESVLSDPSADVPEGGQPTSRAA